LSAVEGLIYEMADTSVPVEMEGTIPVVVPQIVVEQDDMEPSPYALPRRPPRVYPYIEPSSQSHSRSTSQANPPANQPGQVESNQESSGQYQQFRPEAENPSNLYWLDTREINPVSPAAQITGTDQGRVGLLTGQQQQTRRSLERNDLYQPPSNPMLASKASTDSAGSGATTISSPATLSRSDGSASTATFDSILGEMTDASADPKNATKVKERKTKKFRRIFS
jgi:hypothetical protein